MADKGLYFFIGVVLLCAGTVMGAVALGSPYWLVTDDAVVRALIPGSGGYSNSTCNVGIFGIRCMTGDTNEYAYQPRYNMDSNADSLNAIRACYVVAVVMLLLSVLCLLLTVVKDLGTWTNAANHFTALLYSIGTALHIMVVISYVMVEYKSDPGFFTLPSVGGSEFDWAMYVGAIGALLCPPAVFIICTRQHSIEDKEAGVVSDYDSKCNQDTYI